MSYENQVHDLIPCSNGQKGNYGYVPSEFIPVVALFLTLKLRRVWRCFFLGLESE